MSNMWVALLLAVTGGIGYQLSQKLLPTNINPFLIFASIYFIAFILCLIVIFFGYGIKTEEILSHKIKWLFLLLALSTILIESGYLFAFRLGAPLSTFGISVMVFSSIILFVIGIYFFKETITVTKFFGLVFCITGIFLIKS